MRGAFVLGRTLFGGFFVYRGVDRLRHAGATGGSGSAEGVPAAEQAVRITGALLVAGGVSVATGFKPRQGLAAIVAALVPVTLQRHRFWNEPTRAARQAQTVQFATNLALVGAALAMMRADEPRQSHAEPASSDDEEMFIRLGGRDLRSLPV